MKHMAKHTAFFVGALTAFLVVPLLAIAASFDCGKASSQVEKIICANPDLSKLDESLNESYQAAVWRTSIEGSTVATQEQWLQDERNVCRDAACVRKAYETRIRELEAVATWQGQLTNDDEDVSRSLGITGQLFRLHKLSARNWLLSFRQTRTKENPRGAEKFEKEKDRDQQETFIVRPGRICRVCLSFRKIVFGPK